MTLPAFIAALIVLAVIAVLSKVGWQIVFFILIPVALVALLILIKYISVSQ